MDRYNLLRLSASTLGLFRECPRCFWLLIRGDLRRPSGPFPSLPGGIDQHLKDYFDKYRGGLPPELSGKVSGVLMRDLDNLKNWRNWQTGLSYREESLGVEITGAFDDCLEHDGAYVPVDFKTRGWAPKEGTTAYYEDQLDVYTLLLDRNSYTTKNQAVLVYYYPKNVREGGSVLFEVEPETVPTHPEHAWQLVGRAVALVRGLIPNPAAECEFCAWQLMS